MIFLNVFLFRCYDIRKHKLHEKKIKKVQQPIKKGNMGKSTGSGKNLTSTEFHYRKRECNSYEFDPVNTLKPKKNY